MENKYSRLTRFDELKIVKNFFSKVEKIQIQCIKKKFDDYFDKNQCDLIKSKNLDILFRRDFRILKGEILDCAKFGVWSFHHGDNDFFRGLPPGFWECFLNKNITGVSRDKIFSALVAEGIPDLIKNYFNLHLLPIYQNKLAYGTKGFPWKSEFNKNKINYNKGICPTAENLNKSQLILLELCVYEYSKKEIDLIIKCFNKVWKKLIK